MKFSLNRERSNALRTQFFSLLHKETNEYLTADGEYTVDVFKAIRFERLWKAREFKNNSLDGDEFYLVECKFVSRIVKE